MAKTLQERFLAALLARGEREVKRTSRYVVVSRTENSFYFLGRAGAVRIGRSTRESIPMNEKTRQLLLSDGKSVDRPEEVR